MEVMTHTHAETPGYDILMKWLCGTDPQNRCTAIEFFRRLGRLATSSLIYEAIKPGTKPQHRIAILDAVEQIGGPLGFDDMCRLQSLLQYGDRNVARKAKHIIKALGRAGLVSNPGSATLQSTFNPFLGVSQRRPRRPSLFPQPNANSRRRAERRKEEELADDLARRR
jgi:hypothetical protein